MLDIVLSCIPVQYHEELMTKTLILGYSIFFRDFHLQAIIL